MGDMKSIIPVLTGPTATGKTAWALQLGLQWPISVINADASLVYRFMDIGTAKPSLAERQQVPHHLIDVINPDQNFSVTTYLNLAEEAIFQTLNDGRIPLVVGGTGYYLRTLSEGLFALPEPDSAMQQELWRAVQQHGLEPLRAELLAVSPTDYERVGLNPRRVIRAIEVLRRSGKPPAQFEKRQPRFAYRKVVLWPEWNWLEPRLSQRVHHMFQRGLVAEVSGLLQQFAPPSTAWQSIGYKEVLQHIRGELNLAQAQSQVLQATRLYAKRQYTWFRKEPEVAAYLNPVGLDNATLAQALGLWASSKA